MITNDMIDLATKAVVADLKHGTSHGCRIRWGTSPDNFNLDGHVDLRSIARAALSVVKDSLTTADTTQEKT